MARIRRVRSFQRHDDPAMLIAAMGRPAVRKALREALKHLPEVMDEARAKHLYANGRLREIADTVDWKHFREILKTAFERIAQIYEAAARLGVRKINGAFAAKRRKVRFHKSGIDEGAPLVDPEQHLAEIFNGWFDKAVGDRFAFDRFNESTQRKLREYQDELISDLTTGARDTIEAVVLAGTRAGLTPDAIVGDIRSMINLTDTQATAVMNYRTMLTNMDSGALRRQLRDAAFDETFSAARASGVGLDDAIIDEMVSAYEDNYLDYRANSIAQTESVRASNTGLRDAYEQAVERGAFPDDAVRRFWQTSMLENVCPVCLSIPDMNPDGVGLGEDFQSSDGPVSDPPDPHTNCLPGNMLVRSPGATGAMMRWYEGDLVVIRTASGNELSCTPNHPVLTDAGWVAARLLDVGSNVVCAGVSERVGVRHVDKNHVPTSIEEIANTFRLTFPSAAVHVPVSGPDFHGDGEGSEIAVVVTNRNLGRRFNSSLAQRLRNHPFGWRCVQHFLSACRGAAAFLWQPCFPPLGCNVCGSSLAFPVVLATPKPTGFLRFADASDCNSALDQPASNTWTRYAKRNRNSLFRFTRLVGFYNRVNIKILAKARSRLAVCPREGDDKSLANAVSVGDLFGALSSTGLLENVVSRRVVNFSGHVFNLETVFGAYVAENIVVHNCACSVEYVTDLDKVPDDAESN